MFEFESGDFEAANECENVGKEILTCKYCNKVLKNRHCLKNHLERMHR